MWKLKNRSKSNDGWETNYFSLKESYYLKGNFWKKKWKGEVYKTTLFKKIILKNKFSLHMDMEN